MAKNIDLTGDPEVEEQIRQYYVKKKHKEESQKVVFVEGVATREMERVVFTIDCNHKALDEDIIEMERQNKKAWDRYYKGEKARRKHEKSQEC